MITPGPGYIVDPNNPNGVIKDPKVSTTITPATTAPPQNQPPAAIPPQTTTPPAQTPPPTQTTPIETVRSNSGTYTGEDGKKYYNYDGTPTSSSTSQTSTGASSVNPQVQSLLDQENQRAADFDTASQKFQTTITNLSNGTTPLTAAEQAQVDGLKQQFQTLIDEQKTVNTSAVGLGNVRGYQTGAAEYDPMFQVKTIGGIISAGTAKVADLQTKEAAAVASLTQSLRANDINAAKTAWDAYQSAYDNRQKALQDTIEKTQAAIKEAADAKVAAEKTYYDEVTKPIQDLGLTAAKNGASPEVLTKIKGAQTVDEAIAAAGTSIQTSTNADIAQYLFYKQQAQAAGQSPVSYDAYQKQQNALANSQAYSKAFSTAAGTAAGQASINPTSDAGDGAGLGGNSTGGSILSATGLSIAAFNYMTQGTASMSRMTAGQRAQILKESEDWLNKHGVDISTFQSQYKAYNDVLQKNINRANQTKIMAGEVTGSADSLIEAIVANGTIKSDPLSSVHVGQGLGSVRAANILELMAGKQVNNKFVQTYSTQIHLMANDLAGYMAAARGATAPELQDQRDAAEVIANGMNKGSIEAFRDAILANEGKVAGVVNNAVQSTQKQVWDLFGVGSQYKNPLNTSDILLQQNKDDPGGIGQHLNDSSSNPNDPAGLF